MTGALLVAQHLVGQHLVGQHLVGQHLGALHRYELALLLVVAFGPFVVLAVVVHVVRRRDLAEENGGDEDGEYGGVEDER